MKESEKLKEEAAEKDNDLAAMGIYKKVLRAERNEKFEEKWLPKFKEKYGDKFIYDGKKFCYTLILEGKTIDFYPKANKYLIRQENKWIKPGLRKLLADYLPNTI